MPRLPDCLCNNNYLYHSSLSADPLLETNNWARNTAVIVSTKQGNTVGTGDRRLQGVVAMGGPETTNAYNVQVISHSKQRR